MFKASSLFFIPISSQVSKNLSNSIWILLINAMAEAFSMFIGLFLLCSSSPIMNALFPRTVKNISPATSCRSEVIFVFGLLMKCLLNMLLYFWMSILGDTNLSFIKFSISCMFPFNKM